MNKSMYTIFHQIDLNVVLENFSYVVDNFLFKADGAFQGIPLSGVSNFMIYQIENEFISVSASTLSYLDADLVFTVSW